MPENELIESITKIDRLMHEPARMAILTVLSSCISADFVYLQAATRLTRGNLSLHISKLEEHGIIKVDKMFVRKIPRTMVQLTKEGKAEIRAYWRFMDKAKRAQSGRQLLRQRLSFDPGPRTVRQLTRAERRDTMPSRSDVPRGYRAMTIMAREQDAVEMKRIADVFKNEGWTHASASFVHRMACVMLCDAVRGKSAEEIIRFFVDYRARRKQQRVGTPGTPSLVKA